VYENRVLRRIFGPKREEMAGSWIRVHKEELFHTSPSIIKVIKSRRMRLMGHVTFVGEMIKAYKSLLRKPKGKRL
jgi:hypothetical protein